MLEWNLGSPATDLRAKLPACYSAEFDACITEVGRAKKAGVPPKPSAYCDQYYSLINDTTDAVWDEAMGLLPYCSSGEKGKRKPTGFLLPLAVIGLAAGAVAIVVNATGSRF